MKVLTCGAARRRLQAFYDGELSVGDQIAVASHLEWCDDCAREREDLGRVSAMLRASMPGRAELTADEESSLQARVVSRMKAEQTVSLAAQAREMFEDMRLVYAGVGGAAAAMVSIIVALGVMMQFAGGAKAEVAAVSVAALEARPPELPLVAAPEPRVQLPRPLEQAFSADYDMADDAVIMMVALVTREGRVSDLSLLVPGGGRSSRHVVQTKAIEDLLGAVSRARFEPARVDGLPVEMNMVWVMEHTTVRAKSAVRKRSASLRLAPGSISV